MRHQTTSFQLFNTAGQMVSGMAFSSLLNDLRQSFFAIQSSTTGAIFSRHLRPLKMP